MKNNMEGLLKAALTPMNEPDEQLNHLIIEKAGEKNSMKRNRKYKNKYRRNSGAMAACLAAFVLLTGGVTAVAAYRYLSPEAVALELEDSSLEKAFTGEGALLVNESQEEGNYRITLLGSVAGKNISDYLPIENGKTIEQDNIYTAIAIERIDGTPMPETSSEQYGEETFFVSHFIQGLDPEEYNIMTMNGGYQEFVKDGIMYRLLEMDNVEMFADKDIYVGVCSGTFYDRNAYSYEESNGNITCREDYGGVNVLFKLPVDKTKADPEAAGEYLKQFAVAKEQEESFEEMNSEEVDAIDRSVDEYMEKLTPENIDEYAVAVEGTRQICPVDEKGMASYQYELGDAAEEGTINVAMYFPDGKTGMSDLFGYSYTETGLQNLVIETFTLEEDGTVTFVVYVPKTNQ